MLRTGLSAVIGACGTKAIARPSSARRRAGGIVSRSSPSNSRAPAVTAKPAGSNCAMARPTMVLPAPDSPTKPRILPGASLKERSRIAGTVVPPMRALMVRLRASSANTVLMPGFSKPYIERPAQAIAEQIESGDGEEDGDDRQQQIPRRLIDVLPRVGDHLAPCRLIGPDAEPDERQDRLDHHRDRHLQAEQGNEQRQRCRQDFAHDGLPVGKAQKPRRRHVIVAPYDQYLAAQHAAEPRPIDQHDGENDTVEPD